MSMTVENKIERIPVVIRKLITQASNKATSPEEAAAFLAKAEELMVRYSVSEAQLQAVGDKPRESIVQRDVELDGMYAPAYRDLAFVVGKALGTRPIATNYRNTKITMHFCGFESDVDRTEFLFTSLMTQMMSSMRAWNKEAIAAYGAWPSTRAAYKARFGFCFGFTDQVGFRLRETHRKVAAEPTVGPSTALVLRERTAEIDEWIDKRYGKLRHIRRPASSHHGHTSGREAGARADVGGARIAGRKALPS